MTTPALEATSSSAMARPRNGVPTFRHMTQTWVPAVWKRGRVIANGGGQVCNTDCIDEAGDGFLRSVKITH